MRMRVIVICAKGYDFNDDNGRRVTGTSVFCITGAAVTNGVGMKVDKITVDYGLLSAFTQAPAVYDLEIEPSLSGKAKITDARFVHVVNLFDGGDDDEITI